MTTLEYVTLIAVGIMGAALNVETGTICYTGGCVSNTGQGGKVKVER
jgi:hypothetical protein